MPTSTKSRDTAVSVAPKSAVQAPRILAADDQQHILEAIELLVKPQGYLVDTARSPVLVREALASTSYDAVLIVTDHDCVDYVNLAASSRLIVDTRNACARAGAVGGHIVKA